MPRHPVLGKPLSGARRLPFEGLPYEGGAERLLRSSRSVTEIFDSDLDDRVLQAHARWEAEAEEALTGQVGAEELERLREAAEGALEELREKVKDLEEAVEGVELPDRPRSSTARSRGAMTNR